MKPLHLNLASRPYRDERPFILVVVIGSLLIAYLTLTNFDTWYRYRNETQETRAKIVALEKQAADERASTATLNQRLRAVDVKMLAKQTQFANIQLAQRAFSWSELLDHLENVLADDVRITSVAPSFGENGIIHLQLNAAAKSSDGMVKTITRFNKEGSFSNPFPSILSSTEKGDFNFTMSVDYRPSAARVIP